MATLGTHKQAAQLRDAVSRLLQVFKVEESVRPDGPYAKLNLPDLNVVLFLGETRSPVTMGAIAAYLDARLSTAGTIADRLVRAGLLQRKRVDEDRRVVLVSLTDEGTALFRETVAVQLQHCQAMLDVLSTDAERMQLLGLLAKVAKAADDIRAKRNVTA